MNGYVVRSDEEDMLMEEEEAATGKESTVFMWGYLPGALPQRSPLLSPVIVRLPASVGFGDSWKDVCGGGCGFAMAITESGKLITWGSTDDMGQSYVTSGKHGETPEPFPLPTEASMVKATAGWAHCISVTETGDIYTWGWKECVPTGKVIGDQPAGGSMETDQVEPHSSLMNEQASPRSQGSRSTSGAGFGGKGGGVEGTKRRRMSSAKQAPESSTAGDEILSALPCLVTLSPGVRIVSVSAGGRHTLALSDMGQVWGWGYGGEGQLGLGSRIRMVSSPHPIPCIETSAYGQGSSSAISRGGMCSEEQVYKPCGTYVTGIACGGRHSAVITDAGAVLTFGWGLYGQLKHQAPANSIISQAAAAMKQHLNASNALASLLLLLLQIILIFQTPTTTRAEEWEKTFIALRQCQNDSSNYTSGSKFKSNLVNHLLPTLIANGSRSGFLTASFGKDPDIVYGLVQCRGDISEEDCQNCLNTSSVEIIRTCPNKKTAGLRLSKCLIRYSGLRFFSKLDADKLDNTTWSWENDKPISNPVVYNQQLEGLMTNLMSNASSIPSRFMTGSTSTKSDDFSNIYGLVQCTQDLSITDCLTCLQVMFDRSKNCCSGRKGKWILSLSCQIWYRDKLFFQLSSPPPPPPLIPPPPPAPAPAPQALVGTIIYACFAFLLFHIGLLCVQEDTKVRPAMSSVVNMLDASYALASPHNTACSRR